MKENGEIMWERGRMRRKRRIKWEGDNKTMEEEVKKEKCGRSKRTKKIKREEGRKIEENTISICMKNHNNYYL